MADARFPDAPALHSLVVAKLGGKPRVPDDVGRGRQIGGGVPTGDVGGGTLDPSAGVLRPP